jgi:hypothetical protein
MPMQSLCHTRITFALLGATALYTISPVVMSDEQTSHDYPTHARVEFVQECIASTGGKLASLYQCSCVIDEIAKKLSYEEFVEASTFSRYSALGGDRGGLFRDPEHGKKMAKEFVALEGDAAKRCGLPQ